MIILTVVFCVFAIFAYFVWKKRQLYSTLPPGPPGWPFIGNLLELDRDDPRRTFMQWHKKYGPIFTVWFGCVPYVFVTGYDLMQELFVKRGDEFADRPNSFIFDETYNGKYGIVNIMGDVWKEQRRFSLHTLRNFGFGRRIMEEQIVAETEKFLNSMDKQFNSHKSANVDVKDHIDLCVSNIISSIMVGQTYKLNDPTFAKMKASSEKMMTLLASFPLQLLDSFPWLRYLPFFNYFHYHEFKQCLQDFFDILKAQLVKNKETFDPNNEPINFTDAYLKEMKRRKDDGEDTGSFDDWQLLCVIGDIWGAAIETTVTTLYWAVLLMMYYPEVQKKVQQEIDSVVGEERLPDMNDKAKLPYLSAVINEVQRYVNIIIINVPHTVNKDANVLSYMIPKGITVIPQISVVHYDETLHSQPLTFDPDRFLDKGDGTTLSKHEHLLPFSLGKRVCLGESLARMELFLIFSALMQKYSFDFVENEPKPTMKPKIGFTASPFPYRTCVTARSVN